MDDWIKKMWYINTMQYYLTIRKDEILPFATTWMVLENIMLSEIVRKNQESYDFTHMCDIKVKQQMNSKTNKNSKTQQYGVHLREKGMEKR